MWREIKFGKNCICWVEDKRICRFGLLCIYIETLED